MHTRKIMSTVLSEEINVIPEDDGVSISTPANKSMRSPDNPLQDYVLRVMRDNGLSYPEVERMARRRGGELGKSTVQQIAKGQTPNPGIYTLVELAWGLSRPVEEVVGAALGNPVSESNNYKRSEFANLADLHQQLPAGEQRVFKRYLQMLDREMRRILMQLTEDAQPEK
jgi:hypothetical protein